MKVIKKTGQKYPSNVNRVTGEYQIRTVAGNQRNRSPIEASSHNMRRSPNRIDEQLNSDSALEEMIYLDPNEANFRRGQNMSPLNDSHNNMVMPSPNEGNRNDYTSGGIVNMTQRMNFRHHPRYQQNNMDDRKETSSRSPKTINVGESAQDMEYNIKTFNKRNNNLNMMNSPQNNFIGDRSYNMNLNETGNIFLDQPMQQAYNQQNEPFNLGLNDQRNATIDQNSREMQFGMNPRDMQEPRIGVLRKMSPKGNVEGDSDSNSEKYDNVNQVTDLKSQLDRNMHVMFKNEDGIGDRNRLNRGDIDNIRLMAKSRDFQENATGDEVKKLIKYYVKTYDPHKGEDGNLISNSQTVILSNQAQLFNDRYKVLQKMNKLSNILLSKKKSQNVYEISTLNRSLGEGRSFDKNTLNKTTIGKKTTTKGKHNKFLFVSLAMLSAKNYGKNGNYKDLSRENNIFEHRMVKGAENLFSQRKMDALSKGDENHLLPNHPIKGRGDIILDNPILIRNFTHTITDLYNQYFRIPTIELQSSHADLKFKSSENQEDTNYTKVLENSNQITIYDKKLNKLIKKKLKLLKNPHGYTKFPHGCRWEIGRASCRERV